MARTPSQRGQTLIGLIITLAIVLILAAIFFPQMAGNNPNPGGPRTPMQRAHGTACAVYASQLNQALFMFKSDHDDHSPRNLEELKSYGATDDMIYADGCYFVIDQQSQQVVDRGLSQVHWQQAPTQYYSDLHTRQRMQWYGPNGAMHGFHPDDAAAKDQSASAGSSGTSAGNSGGSGGSSYSGYSWKKRRYNPGGGDGFASGPSQDASGQSQGSGSGFGPPPPTSGPGPDYSAPRGGGQAPASTDDGGGDDTGGLRPAPPPRVGPGGIPLPTAGYGF